MHMFDERRAGASVVGDAEASMSVRTFQALFAGCDDDGRFLVARPGAPGTMVALSTTVLGAADVGTRVLVLEGAGRRDDLIIVGRVLERNPAPPVRARLDGERVVIRAEHEIELRCGDASIMLTKAGKVIVRGNYIVTHSRGANKIKGAFVGIN